MEFCFPVDTNIPFSFQWGGPNSMCTSTAAPR